jgi:excisionase family DNA binding protein
MTNETKPQLLGLNAVTARTDLSKSTIYRLINKGHLKAVKVGKALRISESELSRFIQALESGELSI